MLRTILLLATLAVGPVRADDGGDVVWVDWLAEAPVWELAEGGVAIEPAPFGPEETAPVVALRRVHVDPAVRPIPAAVELKPGERFVRYDVPLDDASAHAALATRGLRGELVTTPIKAGSRADSTLGKYSERVAAFFGGDAATAGPDEVLVVRYDAPADDIALHAELARLPSEIIEPGMLRLPEVRFFQPKARVYLDLKRTNDEEFDLFTDGSFLASLDVVELYFPMPLISERFARTFGRSSRLSGLGWRVGGTVGFGIATALNEGESKGSGSPISTLSAGLRYEFPLGRPSDEVLRTGDWRLDRRTRVGIEGGVQGGLSADESIGDATDLGLYFGLLVNTPWGG